LHKQVGAVSGAIQLSNSAEATTVTQYDAEGKKACKLLRYAVSSDVEKNLSFPLEMLFRTHKSLIRDQV
jgi:hypothetical protein